MDGAIIEKEKMVLCIVKKGILYYNTTCQAKIINVTQRESSIQYIGDKKFLAMAHSCISNRAHSPLEKTIRSARHVSLIFGDGSPTRLVIDV